MPTTYKYMYMLPRPYSDGSQWGYVVERTSERETRQSGSAVSPVVEVGMSCCLTQSS